MTHSMQFDTSVSDEETIQTLKHWTFYHFSKGAFSSATLQFWTLFLHTDYYTKDSKRQREGVLFLFVESTDKPTHASIFASICICVR